MKMLSFDMAALYASLSHDHVAVFSRNASRHHAFTYWAGRRLWSKLFAIRKKCPASLALIRTTVKKQHSFFPSNILVKLFFSDSHLRPAHQAMDMPRLLSRR
jgi:hypothetical protein